MASPRTRSIGARKRGRRGAHRAATPQPDGAPRALAALRRRLLAFFDAHHRDLPWRGARDPWAVLVSEVMLQQTTVAAVLPRYERFLARWPTPRALAAATRDELLAEWAGLGYYRRALNLHAAALAVADAHDGSLPGAAAALRELPGVGEYTAAAVASIAYGEPVAAVDGNVERVLCRVFALAGDPRRAAARAALRAHAARLLDPARPGDFNQALMDLGATVCRPLAPRCGDCPLRADCRALATGRPQDFPELPPRRTPVDVLRAAALVERGGRVLLLRRDGPPNAGFLELPGVELARGPAAALAAAPSAGSPRAASRSGTSLPLRAASRALAAALRDEHGLTIATGEALAPLRHTITHHRIVILPLRATLRAGRAGPPLLWADSRAPDLPLTTATRRILERARRPASATIPPR